LQAVAAVVEALAAAVAQVATLSVRHFQLALHLQ
jgi:hypothetical protein